MARRDKDSTSKEFDGYANLTYSLPGSTKVRKLGGVALHTRELAHKLLLELGEEINDEKITLQITLRINDQRDAEEESLEDLLAAARKTAN